VVLPPYLVTSPAAEAGEGMVRMLTIILRATNDKTRDVLRIRRIHGMVTSFPGNDHFAVHVFEKGHGYLVEFPNFTCGVCDEMLNRLGGIAGTENVRVEIIRFQ
jgi:hypothetical protein